MGSQSVDAEIKEANEVVLAWGPVQGCRYLDLYQAIGKGFKAGLVGTIAEDDETDSGEP